MYCVIMRKQCLAVFVALTVILNNQWQVVFAEDQGVNPDKNDPEYPVNFEESLDSNEECSAGEGAHRILNRQTRQAIKEDDPNCLKRWPNGHIPWRFERTTNAIQPEQEQGIRDAIAEWERLTCLTLEDINDDDTKWNQEHFLIQNQHSLGCYAIIGRYCGKHGQIVNIASVCTSQGLIMHELAHGFGVYHQHTRPDRDDYVIIVDENVPDARKIDFQMVDSEIFDIPYDYGSVMHYSKTTAGSETNPTILTKDPQRQFTIGNNEKPTHYDIALINRMYNCSGHCENPPTCENGGYVDKHCNCSCPHNTEGSRCETVTGEYYTNVLDSCGDQLVEDTTVIKTFNFPNVKPVGPKFYKCMWYLKSPAGKKAQVTFTNFNLYAATNDKCVFDKLDMMYDLYTSGERVCGNTFQGQTISATQGSLVMVWTASTMGFATGFQATVTFVDDIQPTTAPPTPPPTVPPTPKPPQPTTVAALNASGTEAQFAAIFSNVGTTRALSSFLMPYFMISTLVAEEVLTYLF